MNKFYPQKLYYQIAALLLVIIITAFFAFGWITARKQTKLLQNVTTESAAKMTRGLADSCIRYFLISDYAGLDELLNKFQIMSGADQIQVYRKDGKILSEVTKDSSTSPRVRTSVNNKVGVPDGGEKITIEDDLMIISQPVVSYNVLGWARIAFNLDYIKQMRHEIWLSTVLTALFWTLLSVAIFMFILKRFAGVIQQLSDFARNLGNFKGELINVQHSSYEIQQLGQALNYASTDLFNKENELKVYRDNLETQVATRTAELEKLIIERIRTEEVLKRERRTLSSACRERDGYHLDIGKRHADDLCQSLRPAFAWIYADRSNGPINRSNIHSSFFRTSPGTFASKICPRMAQRPHEIQDVGPLADL